MGPDTPQHWQRTDSDGVAWLVLDRADSSSNTLSRQVLEELEARIAELESAPGVSGLVFKSGKPGGFILGADVSEFGELDSAERGAQLAARGQRLFNRIAALEVPSVAVLDGYALGGGLELALACDYRVAARSYERTLGLPEVQLGIHPGFGGTVRTVELLGAPKALDLMLSGRSVSPVEAESLGLVDRVVERGQLDATAVDLVRSKPPRRSAPWYLGALNVAAVRPLLARRIRPSVARRAPARHYPAPHALLDLWVRHGGKGEAAYRAEAESIGRLLVTQTCRNLVRMFLLRERLRHLAPKTAPAVERVHVVGAGVMGGDIASWCALKGLSVTLQDQSEDYVKPALERASALFAKRLRGPGEAEDARRRLDVDIAADRVGEADLVVEAIVEKLEAKQGLFRDLEPKLSEAAVLATNTSSLELERLAEALSRPERFVGLHFFNPVAKLPLVEVVRGEATDDATLERALSFVTRIGKLPLPCRSAPGFVVNRILTPYMLEALLAHADGHSLETIDDAATRFGMPTGPIELADRVGLDVALNVARILSEVIGMAPPALLEQRVAEGRLGAKTGHGFYRYESGRAQKARDYARSDEALSDRLILPMLNEAVACYADGVVEDLDLLDAGVVFGTGFAPFRGGPVHYARQRGIGEVVERLERLAKDLGPRFEPHAGWERLRSES